MWSEGTPAQVKCRHFMLGLSTICLAASNLFNLHLACGSDGWGGKTEGLLSLLMSPKLALYLGAASQPYSVLSLQGQQRRCWVKAELIETGILAPSSPTPGASWLWSFCILSSHARLCTTGNEKSSRVLSTSSLLSTLHSLPYLVLRTTL